MSINNAQIAEDSKLLVTSFQACQESANELKDLVTGLSAGQSCHRPKLIASLQHAIAALEKAYAYEKKVLCNECDDLDPKSMDSIPEEVQDWLSSTFTRKLSISNQESKHKFKNIANVIRVGILVDKLYRRASIANFHVSAPVASILKKINDWDFDVFSLHETSNGQSLKYIGIEVLNRFDLINRYKIPMRHLESFMNTLQTGYAKYNNSYHNVIHAADVTQTVYYLIHKTKLQDTLTDTEKFGCLIAALIHDYEHTGTTNNFHIKTNSPLALTYNDRSVLENYHLTAAFLKMREGETAILSSMSNEEYREFRALVIDMVLATDMSSHFQQVKTIKHLLALPEYIEKSKALSLILHAADISHPCKPWAYHEKWTHSLMQEFFHQGERELELGLPYSPLCDKNTTLIPDSQIGFINYIVDPCFQVMEAMLEAILTMKDDYKSLKENSMDVCSDSGLKNSVSELLIIKEPKKLKHTPWNHHLAENRLKWKGVIK